MVLWRRLTQALFLILFLFLFRKTDYGGTDEISYAVNIFFRWDPLVAASAMLAAKVFIALLLPALAVVVTTLVLGRFFCGWVCPLGTCLDMTHTLLPPRSEGREKKWSRLKYYLLFVILVTALFGVPLVGYFDPFSILVRGLAISVDPAFNIAVSYPFDFIYKHGPGWMSAFSEPVFSFLKDTILPFNKGVFNLVLPTLAILASVFALEKIERRFWCRNICPLGAMLALLSRPSLLRMQPGRACKAKGCADCVDVCRMRAINDDGTVSPESCNLCMDCVEVCDKGLIGFGFKRPRHDPAPMDMGRRGMVGSLAAGLFAPAFLKVRAISKKPDPLLIRPPGAIEEGEFLARCVRCGECMKVCVSNALQPTGLQAGIEGVFSPVLVPRIGYCEYNCTLCGQVCPTGAIERLPKKEKQEVKMGRAFFDRDRCLPWAKGVPCLVCEEICPVPEKAIKMVEEKTLNHLGEQVSIQRPYLNDALCTGCGACENKCPVPGRAAVRITSEGESRDPNYF